MKILAFAGTNSRNSINAELVKYVVSQFEGSEVDFVDLNDYEMPLYSIDREVEGGVPDLAKNFASKIDNSDLIVMSLAEHNGTYSVAFKNVFDWVSRIPGRPHWGDKDILVMSTSPGPRGGAGVLAAAIARLPFNGGKVIESYSLPHFKKFFDAEKGIIDEEKAKELANKITTIKETLVVPQSVKVSQ